MLDRILNLFARPGLNKDRLFSSIQIELTNHCTNTCRYCPQSIWRSNCENGVFNREKGYMDKAFFKEVFTKAVKYTKLVNFSFFGEPMMHPDFLEIMDYVGNNKDNVRIVINTNLSLATREIFEKLIEICITELRLSIDSSTSETFEKLRPGKICFDLNGNTIEGNRFEDVTAKAEYWLGLSDHRPTRHVFAVNSQNVKEVKDFFKKWHSLLGKDDSILFKRILSYGGNMADDMVENHECNVWRYNMLTIDWQGNMSPCNLDVNMALNLGNIRNVSLGGLSKSKKYKELKRMSMSKSIQPCKSCFDANNWDSNILLRSTDVWNESLFSAIYHTPEVDSD
ncbi:MAG: radical SAM protein [Candidatus Aegiribacteria sp.]|nr:radical SAM protein [Candidatus Aegiribacteria sp.]